MNEQIIVSEDFFQKNYREIVAHFDGLYIYEQYETSPEPICSLVITKKNPGVFLKKIDKFIIKGSFIWLGNRQYVHLSNYNLSKRDFEAPPNVITPEGKFIPSAKDYGNYIAWYSGAKYTKYLVEWLDALYLYDVKSLEFKCVNDVDFLPDIRVNGNWSFNAQIFSIRNQKKKTLDYAKKDRLHSDSKSIPRRSSEDYYTVFMKCDTGNPYHHFCHALNDDSERFLKDDFEIIKTEWIDEDNYICHYQRSPFHETFWDNYSENGKTLFIFDPNGDFIGLFNNELDVEDCCLDGSIIDGRFLYLVENGDEIVVDLGHLEGNTTETSLREENFWNKLIIRKPSEKPRNFMALAALGDRIKERYKGCPHVESWVDVFMLPNYLGEDKIINAGMAFYILDYLAPTAETLGWREAFPETFRREVIAFRRCLWKLGLGIPEEIFWYICRWLCGPVYAKAREQKKNAKK